jgi:hypothetical protein
VSNKPTLSYEDTKLIVQQFVNKIGKNRRPSSMVPRKGRYSVNAVPTLKPPYNTSDLDRFEDCFRSDGVAQRGIIKRCFLVMGKHGRIVMDTTEEFDNEDDRKAKLQEVQKNAKYLEARKQMQKLHIKPEINFHNNMMAGLIQSKVYGRAALEIISPGGNTRYVTPEGEELEPLTPTDTNTALATTTLPEALHLCNSKRLGKVEIEAPTSLNPGVPNTWKFIGVHYLDMGGSSSIGQYNVSQGGAIAGNDLFKAENIIYMANKDYHISPGSLYYGLSDLETVIDGSEAKRIAKQEDIKEALKSNWAPYVLLKFLNPNITTTQMQEVIDNLLPGVPTGTKQDVEAQILQMNAELDKIPNVIDFLNQETIRDMGLPSFILGYEQIANYANSQQILLALKEIELEAERTWLADIIERQWLNRFFYQLLGLGEGDEAEVKLKYEFSDVTFETTLDKVNAALPLFDRKLYSGEKVLKIADAEDEVDEYKLRAEEQKKLQEQRFGMELKRMDMDEKEIENKVSTTWQKRQAQQQKDDVYSKIKEKLDSI